MADRLASIMPSLISVEQRGFIKDRQIKNCICLASEVANILDKKSYGGNRALKIDVTKVFDTLEWPFLLHVLRAFGFNDTFCQWIEVILNSATMSVSVNGALQGYFQCSRGVRKSDPSSPLLFCLAEDVLSKHISKLVEDNKLQKIQASREIWIPSYCFYADDIMVYCTGRKKNLQHLKEIFISYAIYSGQHVSAGKSTIFCGAMSQDMMQVLAQSIGFSTGSLPFMYLGIPIFKGRPKKIHFQSLVDKIKNKLAAWKAILLSYAGRAQLIRFVLHSMLVYSITTHSLPSSLIKELEAWFRNFLWSRDVSKRKLVHVAWHKVCRPVSEGGLNIRSLATLNDASNLKLCWDLLQSSDPRAIILRARVLRGNKCINHHIHSSIWSGLKNEFQIVLDNSQILIGNGLNTNFWLDIWCGSQCLADACNIPGAWHAFLNANAAAFIQNHQWSIPLQVLDFCPNLSSIVHIVVLPSVDIEDRRVWCKSTDGDLSLKEAYAFKYKNLNPLDWTKIFLVYRHSPSEIDTTTTWRSAVTLIKAQAQLSGSSTNLTFHNSADNFRILKLFDVPIHLSRPMRLKEIFWSPPLDSWVKANTDGAAVNVNSACGVSGALRAIEIAQQYNWNHLWLETDSSLVVKAFNNLASIPWSLQNRWFNCRAYIRQIHFLITHVYREANSCADLLANEGLFVDGYQAFIDLPQNLTSSVLSNKLGKPNFRFTHF
ncbi:uncharacterized protein LOC131614988 [Vicia villosa]|uniref:uncharacterized protein LOC131614988 n=1 Tax=Vicia villosa TaxID=3911 RepID=UPI00273BDCCE|nr:uncharacterized protein LOC131614988 [Vicia villosa]